MAEGEAQVAPVHIFNRNSDLRSGRENRKCTASQKQDVGEQNELKFQLFIVYLKQMVEVLDCYLKLPMSGSGINNLRVFLLPAY